MNREAAYKKQAVEEMAAALDEFLFVWTEADLDSI